MIRRVLSWCREFARSGDPVSLAWLQAQAQREGKIGVDLPTWRTPAEVAQMRRIERRRGMRLVKRA